MSLLPAPTDDATLIAERAGESPYLANGNRQRDGNEPQWSHNRMHGLLARGAQQSNSPSIFILVRNPDRPPVPRTPSSQDALARQDAEDMICLCEGDEEAMTRLMHRHAPQLRHVISKMLRDKTEAADVVEETFIRVYRSRERFDIGAKFTAWLYTIALNLARNRLRSRARRPEFVPLEELSEEELESQPFVTNAPSPDVCLENCEVVHELEASLAALPAQLREPLKLFACGDCSQAELGEQFNCSVKAIESRLYNGRKRLRAEFDRFLHPPDTGLLIDPFKPQHEIKTKI